MYVVGRVRDISGSKVRDILGHRVRGMSVTCT